MTQFTQADADEIERAHRERLHIALAALSERLPYIEACKQMVTIIHATLIKVSPEKPITTTNLAERIVGSTAKKTHPAEYNRIFRILKDLSKNQLRDCTSPGTPKPYMGKMSYPKLWHTGPLHAYDPLANVKPSKTIPAEGTKEKVCQHCGGKLS